MSARFLSGCFQIDLNAAPNQFGILLIECLFYRAEQIDRETARKKERQTDRQTDGQTD